MSAFNLTAELNLRGPANIRNVVADIRRQLGTINADVTVRIDQNQIRNIAAINRSLNTLNSSLATTSQNASRAAASMQAFITSMSNINGSSAQFTRNINNLNAATQNNTRQLNNNAGQVRSSATAMEEFGRQSALAVRRFASFSLAAGAILGLGRAIRGAVDDFISFDRAIIKLSQITGESASGLSSLSNTITNLSTNLGTSSKELVGIAATLAQAGLSARETQQALRALALTDLAPSFDNLNQTVEGSIALMRQFDISARDLEKALGSINSVAAKFAVESGDIIAAIQRTGGVFASASRGVSGGTDALNEFIAVFTSVRATTRESAETIATGLRTIFTRIQRGDTIDALKEYGVNLTDVEGKFVGAFKAVELLSSGLSKIDPRDLRFSKIVEELGGFRQIGKVIPLIQQFATAQEALKVAQSGQGSLTTDAAKAQLALAVQAAKVREEFLALFREIGGSDTFQTLAKGALQLASALISVADSVKSILPVLTVMLAFRGASAARQYGTGFLRNIVPGRNANGGQITALRNGGYAPVALMPGEAVIYPPDAKRIGAPTLNKMNHAEKRIQRKNKGGNISVVPGKGNTDSFHTSLPVGSFVIRKKATEAMGPKYIQDVVDDRQKFAQGGLAKLKSSRQYVKNLDTTFDKAPNENIKRSVTRAKEPLRFNLKDNIKANIRRRPISLTPEQINAPVVKENHRKAYLNPDPRIRGYGFENILSDLGRYTKDQEKYSRVDGYRGNTPIEVRSRGQQTSTNVLLDKLMGSIIGERSISEKKVAVNANKTSLNKYPNTIDAGNLLVLEDVTALQKKFKTQKDIENRRKKQKKYFGGDIQKLMAGRYVKPKVGTDITIDDMSGISSTDLLSYVGRAQADNLLRKSYGVVKNQRGKPIAARDVLRLSRITLDSDPVLKQAKDLLLKTYVKKHNEEAAKFRGQQGQQNTKSLRKNLMFGAIGMYGKSFPPTNIDLEAGLKSPTTVRVVGYTLSKNKNEKKAILDKRSQRLQSINARRQQGGKSELVDTISPGILAAPTTASLSKQITSKYVQAQGVTQKQLAIGMVEGIAKQLSPQNNGARILLDFDRTLAYGADKIGSIGAGGIPDYSAFNDPDKVQSGLKKAKLSRLGLKLKKLSKKYPDLLNKMYVVSARGQDTMPLIGNWLKTAGLNIPSSNILGVGGQGVATSAIPNKKIDAINSIVNKAQTSLFIDDDPSNVRKAQSAGIRSIQYGSAGFKPSKKTRGNIEGYGFEDAIRESMPANLRTALFNDTNPSIDFPYGLGSSIAKEWFNAPVLSTLPTDAKRVLNGPRGKIPQNITNYLKGKGYNLGGLIQKLAIGGEAQNIATKLGLGKPLADSWWTGNFAGKDILFDWASPTRGYNIADGSRVDIEQNLRQPLMNRSQREWRAFIDKQAKEREATKKPLTPEEIANLRKYDLSDEQRSKISASAQAKKAQAYVDRTSGLRRDVEDYGQRKKRTQEQYLKRFRGYAIGGGVGTDTVPALLTAGEFVVNRSSAQSIGYGNLSRMNKVGKYAKGGVVQKFATGTSVRPLEAGQTIRSGRMYDVRASAGLGWSSAGDADELNKREERIRARAAERQGTKQKAVRNSPQAQSLRQEINQDTNTQINKINQKYGTNILDIDKRILAVKQAAFKQYSVNLTDAQAMDQLIKLNIKAEKKIVQAKQTAAQRYRQGLKDIAPDITGGASGDGLRGPQSGVSSQYDPRMRTKKGQDYYNRRERVQQARQQRSGGFSGMLRSSLLKTTGAPTVRDLVSTTVPRGLKSVGLMPYSQEERLSQRQAAVRSSIRPVAMGRRTSANLRTTMQGIGAVNDDGQLVRSSTSSNSADRIAASKARKQALIDAGFGKGGANTTAILAGRTAVSQRNSGGGGGGGGSGSGGGGGSGSGGGANAGGGRGRMFGGNAMTMSFVLPMIMDMFNSGKATSESSAKSQAMTQGVGMTLGTTLMTGSMISEMTQGMGGIAAAAGPVAAGFVAVVGLTKAMIDAENAARQFAIEAASNKLETSLEKTSTSLDKYNKDVKDAALAQNVVMNLLAATRNAAQVGKAQDRTQRGFANLLDTGEGSSERSQILFEKGIGAYISATFGSGAAENQSKLFADLIPKRSGELAKNFSGAAQQSSVFLESRVRQGEGLADLGKDPNYKSFINALALADSTIQAAILGIQNSTDLSETEKKERINSIVSIESERKARELEVKTIREMKLEELSRSTNQFQNSLERMFQNMEQSINKSAFALDNMSQKAELSAAALSGSAKSAKTNLRSINVLQNPRAYGAVSVGGAMNDASSSFGDSASTMQGLLRAAGAAEDAIMSSINRSVTEDPSSSDTKIGIRIEENLDKALRDLQLPPDISARLGKEVRQAIGKLRTKGDEKIDFADLVEQVPQLSKVMESAKRAQEVAIKTLQHWENSLNSYGDSMNQIVDIQIQANDKLRKANDIGLRGRLGLDKALGKEVSMRDEISISLAGVRNQTGGVTDPNLIRQNIQRLETTRQEQQGLVSGAGEQVGNASGVIDMQKNLNLTNIALRENYAALKSLADNSEAAGIAMSKLNEIQQKRSATENLIEKAVTSSPQELNSFNRALARVQNNMRGIANIGSTGEQRQESLSALKDILPLLGTGEQQNSIRANVLESMLQESGVGISPIFAQAIQALRNPEADPEMQQAIAEYKKANELQAKANEALAKLDTQIIANTEASSAAALVTAMKTVTFDFNNAELKDIAGDIKTVRNILDERLKAGAPVARASGGLIYASAGQFVNFQPKGTDTVPAMLTPGEFVVNKKATKQNFSLLNNINSGNYSSGGKVKYYDRGGFVFGEVGSGGDTLEYKNRAANISRGEYPALGNSPKDSTNAAKAIVGSLRKNLQSLPFTYYATYSEPRPITAVVDENRIPTSFAEPSLGAKDYRMGDSPVSSIELTYAYNKTPRNRLEPNDKNEYEKTYNAFLKSENIEYVRPSDNKQWGANDILATKQDVIERNIDFDKKIRIPQSDKKTYENALKILINKFSTDQEYDAQKAILSVGAQKIDFKSPKNFNISPKLDITKPNPNADVPKATFKLSNLVFGEQNKSFGLTDDISLIEDQARVADANRQLLFSSVFDSDIGAGSKVAPGLGLGGRTVSKDKPIGRFAQSISTEGYGQRNVFRDFASIGKNNDLLDAVAQASRIAEVAKSAKQRLSEDTFKSELQSDVEQQEAYAALDNLFNNRSKFLYMNSNLTTKYLKTAVPNISTAALLSPTQKKLTSPKAIAQKIASTQNIEDMSKRFVVNDDLAMMQEGKATARVGLIGDMQGNLLNDQVMSDILKDNVTEKAFKNRLTRVASVGLDINNAKNPIAYNKGGDSIIPLGNVTEILGVPGLDEDEFQDNPYYYDNLDKMIKRSTKNKYHGVKMMFPELLDKKGSLAVFPNDTVFPSASVDFYNQIKTLLTDTPQLLGTYSFGNLHPADLLPNNIINNKQDDVSMDLTSLYEKIQAKRDQMNQLQTDAAANAAFTPEIKEAKDIQNLSAIKTTVARKVVENFNLSAAKKRAVKLPEKLSDIPKIAAEIESQIPSRSLSDSVERNSIDAYRAFLYSVYGSGTDNNLALLQKFGLSVNLDDYKNAIEGPDDPIFGKRILRYDQSPDIKDLINNLINREIAIRTGSVTTTAFDTDSDFARKLTITDGILYNTNADGSLTRADDKEYRPQNWNDIKNTALNPKNILFDHKRSHYFRAYQKFIENAKNRAGLSLFPDDIKRQKIQNIHRIATFFNSYDRIRSGVVPSSKDGSLELTKTVASGINRTKFPAFENEKKNYDEEYNKSKDIFRIESDGKILPNFETFQKVLVSELKQFRQIQPVYNKDNAITDWKSIEDPSVEPVTKARGGIIYASTGKLVNYQPRGTDTVPAMLTPGEFVVNRGATQKNLPVLQAINSGTYSAGGIAEYLKVGGIISPKYYATPTNKPITGNNSMFDFTSFFNSVVDQISSSITLSFDKLISKQSTASNGVSSIDSGSLDRINEFTNRLRNVADTLAGLSSIPQEITMTHTHNIIINGDSALNSLSPDLQNIALESIQRAFDKFVNENKEPGAPLRRIDVRD